MHIFYDERFVLPLPPGHRFPMQKYRLLYEAVQHTALVATPDLRQPHPATDVEVLRVHDLAYLQRVDQGALAAQEQRRIGFPWSTALGERERLVAGATIDAARSALLDGLAVNLAGGTHHAFHDHGAGYCVFNDAVIAARTMQSEGRVRRVVIIDCDVHQGDGTAAITADDPSIYTFSIHGAKNYPFHKQRSDLDIALDDDTADDAYLGALEAGLQQALAEARADLAIYVAGADPFVHDQLGRLAVTKTGLAERDRMVLDACAVAGMPVAITMAGGYARNVDDTVDIHLQTVRLAAAFAADQA
jgi:acetoin utilization deacetylase AcuC-like enzyme